MLRVESLGSPVARRQLEAMAASAAAQAEGHAAAERALLQRARDAEGAARAAAGAERSAKVRLYWLLHMSGVE